MKFLKERLLLLSLAVLFCLLLATAVLQTAAVEAVNVDVSGNAAGSNNQVNVNSNNSTSINQNNQSTVDNNVGVNCNTGSNNASGNAGSGGSVNTGNCSANVNISNNLNSNTANIGCPSCPSTSPRPVGQPGQQQPPGIEGVSADGGVGGDGGGQAGEDGPQVLAETGFTGDLALPLAGFGFVFLGLLLTQRALERSIQKNPLTGEIYGFRGIARKVMAMFR